MGVWESSVVIFCVPYCAYLPNISLYSLSNVEIALKFRVMYMYLLSDIAEYNLARDKKMDFM